MERQREYVLRTVEERGVRLIRLWFTDVLGQLKSFAISPAELESAFAEGMHFDGSAIDGFSRVQESDVLALPDPATFEILPWGPPGDERNTSAAMFCDISNLDGSPFAGDPRHVLKRNLSVARDTGFQFYVAPEMEYFYFESGDGSATPQPLDAYPRRSLQPSPHRPHRTQLPACRFSSPTDVALAPPPPQKLSPMLELRPNCLRRRRTRHQTEISFRSVSRFG